MSYPHIVRQAAAQGAFSHPWNPDPAICIGDRIKVYKLSEGMECGPL